MKQFVFCQIVLQLNEKVKKYYFIQLENDDLMNCPLASKLRNLRNICFDGSGDEHTVRQEMPRCHLVSGGDLADVKTPFRLRDTCNTWGSTADHFPIS